MATIKIKNDLSGGFYWIIMSDVNGLTIAKSSESYVSRQGVLDSIDWIKTHAKNATVEDLTLASHLRR